MSIRLFGQMFCKTFVRVGNVFFFFLEISASERTRERSEVFIIDYETHCILYDQ